VRADLLALAAELSARGEPLVLATVVRREPYSSAQPGDMAIITASGAYHGWVGGACAAPTVRREAALVLADGQPRLLSLSPDPGQAARPGVTALPITCHSGGTIEIFLEPVLPAPRLRVFGGSPVARAVAAIGQAAGYATEHLADGAADAAARAAAPVPLFAVVATMGDFDEDAIEAAIAARPAYLGVVASRRRFAELREALLARGVPAAALDAIRNPAGLDLGAHRPEEVAISIFAEIVQLRPAAAVAAEAPPPAPTRAVDPICGMEVEIAGARHTAERDGITYYFCCARCRERFLASPPAPRRIHLATRAE